MYGKKILCKEYMTKDKYAVKWYRRGYKALYEMRSREIYTWGNGVYVMDLSDGLRKVYHKNNDGSFTVDICSTACVTIKSTTYKASSKEVLTFFKFHRLAVNL